MQRLTQRRALRRIPKHDVVPMELLHALGLRVMLLPLELHRPLLFLPEISKKVWRHYAGPSGLLRRRRSRGEVFGCAQREARLRRGSRICTSVRHEGRAGPK